LAAGLTEIYLCNVCPCQEILRRHGRGQRRTAADLFRWFGHTRAILAAVSAPFPSFARPVLTDISLCHACSCQEMLRAETARQEHGCFLRLPYQPTLPPEEILEDESLHSDAAVAAASVEVEVDEMQPIQTSPTTTASELPDPIVNPLVLPSSAGASGPPQPGAAAAMTAPGQPTRPSPQPPPPPPSAAAAAAAASRTRSLESRALATAKAARAKARSVLGLHTGHTSLTKPPNAAVGGQPYSTSPTSPAAPKALPVALPSAKMSTGSGGIPNVGNIRAGAAKRPASAIVPKGTQAQALHAAATAASSTSANTKEAKAAIAKRLEQLHQASRNLLQDPSSSAGSSISSVAGSTPAAAAGDPDASSRMALATSASASASASAAAAAAEDGSEWAWHPLNLELDLAFRTQAVETLKHYTERTPGSFVEERHSAVVRGTVARCMIITEDSMSEIVGDSRSLAIVVSLIFSSQELADSMERAHAGVGGGSIVRCIAERAGGVCVKKLRR
jgi:hypothetical protein